MSLALLTAQRSIRFVALQRALAYSQGMPVHRTMPGKRVLPIVAANFRGDYAEGLGRFPTGLRFATAKGEEVCCSSHLGNAR